MTKSDREAAQSAIRLRRLFYRWLWLVYVPLVLSAVAVILWMVHVLPSPAFPLLAALLAWDALGIRLLVERHRRKVSLPIPRTLVVGLGTIAALLITGVVLAWMGVDRLSSRNGPTLLVIGGFLVLLAMFAPAFKLVDLTLRATGRAILKQRRRQRRHQDVRPKARSPRTRKAA